MVNPTFDTGVFLGMLILAIYFLTASSKIGIIYLLLSTTMFIILGVILVTGYDVTFVNTTSDGTTVITQTSWFITNIQTNQSVQFFGYMLLTLGFVSGVKFLVGVSSKKDPLL